jgi:heat shock protein HtpX
MYKEITANKRKSLFLVLFIVFFIIFLGWLLASYYQNPAIIYIAAVIALFHSLTSYYYSDKIALFMAGARPVSVKEEPVFVRLVENLAITAGLPKPKTYVIEENAINAFACGRNPRNAAIAVTRGALNKLEKVELEGVLAHEISHIKNYDILLATLVVVLVGIISIISDYFWRISIFGRSREEERSNGLLAILGFILILFAPLIATLIQLAISRSREYLADSAGALLTRFPEGLARALEKIKREALPLSSANAATAHLYFASPFGKTGRYLANLFSTHPPIDERIKRLRKMNV